MPKHAYLEHLCVVAEERALHVGLEAAGTTPVGPRLSRLTLASGNQVVLAEFVARDNVNAAARTLITRLKKAKT